MPELARWFKRCGVQTLVVVVPHATGRLPDALKRGLASLDEQAVAALGFERLLLVRSARKAQDAAGKIFFETAAWMLSILKFMIPQAEQPVRPAKLAEFVDAALAVLPPGTHVAAPELLWQANQSTSAGWRQTRALGRRQHATWSTPGLLQRAIPRRIQHQHRQAGLTPFARTLFRSPHAQTQSPARQHRQRR
jgi:hypothetical protein